MDELFEEVRRKVLGYNYLNLILDDWQRVFQKEEERVVDFKVQVCTYLRVLGIETNDKASSGEAHAQLLIQKLY